MSWHHTTAATAILASLVETPAETVPCICFEGSTGGHPSRRDPRVRALQILRKTWIEQEQGRRCLTLDEAAFYDVATDALSVDDAVAQAEAAGLVSFEMQVAA